MMLLTGPDGQPITWGKPIDDVTIRGRQVAAIVTAPATGDYEFTIHTFSEVTCNLYGAGVYTLNIVSIAMLCAAPVMLIPALIVRARWRKRVAQDRIAHASTNVHPQPGQPRPAA